MKSESPSVDAWLLATPWTVAHQAPLCMEFSRQEYWSGLLFSPSVMSDSLWPHELQHTKLLYPSASPGVCSDSCPLSWWCHPAISSSVVPFSSCLQAFAASGYFLMSQFFPSGGQSIGASASASVLLMNIKVFPFDWLVWFPCSPRDSQEFSPTPQFKSINKNWCTSFFMVQLSHPYMTTGKAIALTRRTFVNRVMSLLFITLSVCQ